MANLTAIANGGASRLCYVNTAPSNVITNDTTETLFDTIWQCPAQSALLIAPPSIIRIRCAGIFSTGAVSLGLTLRTRWGGIGGTIIQSTGLFTMPAVQTDMPWWIQGFIIINSNSSSADMESQFFTAFDGNASMTSRQKNGAVITFDSTSQQDVVFTAQWGVATVNNQIQIRAMVVEIDRP